ncbi:globin domain-containing protein [Derxia lacustris]|uniref:globin domain-containing protein n=1 Tax=Derxia lacustris TaxID=764842 RepID=UPI000A174F3C|nr:globin domain-containing protein [Derxia lacustris]
MTSEQIALVQASWQRVLPLHDVVAGIFYAKLFEIDPSLRALFKGDIGMQGRKLVAMLATVIDKLDKLDTVMRDIQSLGRLHVHYGVKDEHYETVGLALLATLQTGLGDEHFPAETRAAWATAYTALADAMKAAAAAARPAA